MTYDKVRQDFEDWCTHQVGEVPYDWEFFRAMVAGIALVVGYHAVRGYNND